VHVTRGFVVATTIASMIALCGCAGGLDDSEGGFGLGTLDADSADAALASAGVDPVNRSGALSVASNGCFMWSSDDDADGAWLVWPAEARQSDDGVILGDGEQVGDGDRLEAIGSLVALSDLPDGGNPDSYFGAYGGFCGAGERGVLVIVGVAG
jgi:hypothetical protein